MTGERSPSGLREDSRASTPGALLGAPVLGALLPVLAVFGPPLVGVAAVTARPDHTRRYAVAVVVASVTWMLAVAVLSTKPELAYGAVPALVLPLAHLYTTRREDRRERYLLAGIYYSPLVVGAVLAPAALL